jgi:DNA-binding PadR family transcriptional regulator
LIREIKKRTGRTVTSGSLYVTLDRLEVKGTIRSRMGDPDCRRGGRPKRFVTPTPEGMRALKEVRATMLSLWSGIEEKLESV